MDDLEMMLNSFMVGGEYERNIDKNNRFVIPSELRAELPFSSTIRIMRSLSTSKNKCLYVYSEENWARLCREFAKTITPDEEGRARVRAFSTSFVAGKVDQSGRFTLDKKMREFAEIKDKLVVVSGMYHSEIWAYETWQKEFGENVAPIDLADLGVHF